MKKRLFLYTTLIVFASLSVFFFASIFITNHNNLKTAEITVTEITQICVDLYKNDANVNEFVHAGKEARITVISSSGNVLADSSPIDIDATENHLTRPEIQSASKNSSETFIRYSHTVGRDFIYYAVKVSVKDSDDYVFIRVAVPVETISAYLLQSTPLLILLFVFIAVLSFFLTRRIVEQVLKPFSHIEERLKLLLRGKYKQISVKSKYEEINKVMNGIDEVALLLQKNAKHREEFFANASHELKTPLTAIKGFNELTAINNKNESLNKYIAGITRETARMLSLIGDMLKLSELDVSKPINENFAVVSLKKVVEDVKETLSVSIAEKALSFKLIGNYDVTVKAEYRHIYDVVKNLIENAVRYNNPNGSILVILGDTRITVTDSGIGISSEEQARIFERFYRVEKSRSQLNGGTGLGLSIVKHICELYGWKLSLKSKIDTGTEITVLFN